MSVMLLCVNDWHYTFKNRGTFSYLIEIDMELMNYQKWREITVVSVRRITWLFTHVVFSPSTGLLIGFTE
jgi:hypothetical protein